MAKLYNTQTRLPEELPADKLVDALAKGTHAYRTDDRVNVVGQDGSVRNVAGNELLDAMRQGFLPESPRQAAVREYVEENKGISGTAKVALGQFADEALFSVPETIFDLTQDPLEVAKKEALKKEHGLANTLAGVAGFGTSLFYGGPLFKTATVAGRATERAILGVGEEAILRGAAEKAAEHEALAAGLRSGVEKFGAQGAAKETFAKSMGSIEKAIGQRATDFEQKAIKERLIAAGYPASQADYASAGLVRKTLAAAANMGVQSGVIASPKIITEALLGDPEKAAEHLIYAVGAGAALGGFGSLGKSLVRTAADVAEKVETSAISSLTTRQFALEYIAANEKQLGRALSQAEKEALLKDVDTTGLHTIGISGDLSKAADIGASEMLGKSPLGTALGGALLAPEIIGGNIGGAVAGFGLSKAARMYAEEPYKIVDGILFAEKAMKKSAELMDKVPEMLSKTTSREAVSTAHLNAISRFIGEDVSKLSKQEQYDKIYEKLSLLQNPDIQAEKIANITSVLSQGGAPEIAQAMTFRMQKMYQYLWQTLPKTKLNSNPFVSDNENKARAKISDTKMSEFEKALVVMMDPYIAFQKAGVGTLTANEIKLMKEFYPGILEDAGRRIQNNPSQYDYNTRLKSQVLTGVDMGVAPLTKRQAKAASAPIPGFPSVPKFKPSNLNLYGSGKQPNVAQTAIQDLMGRRSRNR